jgi:hypothetical protein
MAQTFWSSWVWPAMTAVLGFVFTGLVLAQWLKRRKPHQLAWAVGLLFYAVAACMEAFSESSGVWNPMVYRFYIVLAASLVGFLGLGSLYLTARKRIWGDVFLAYLVVCLGLFLWGSLSVQLVVAKLSEPGILIGGQGLGAATSFPRIMSLFFNIPGSLFLLGGSAWSAVKFSRKREYRYRMWANVLIFVGTMLIAAAGGMARAGTTEGLYLGEMFASAILLAGFLMAGTLDKGAQRIRAERAAGQPSS